ncbi:MAG: hypothetical protein WCA32_21375 [Chromatiaceae bacterium]
MSSIARGDRGSLARAVAGLQQGIKHIRRLTQGIAAIQPAHKSGAHQSFTLCSTPTWRLGLVQLGPEARIPMHDHPGAYAVSHVLAGAVTIDAFALSEQYARGRVQLRQAGTNDLAPGETAILDPWDVNIHRVLASIHGAVLFTGAFANGSALASRRWYTTIRQDGTETIEAAVLHERTANSNVREM